MARSSDPLTEDEIWGTWEELLLACAVNRHGAHSWDSVAAEVRSRSPYANLLTADNCKDRYHLLKRRFTSGGGEGDGINGGDEIDSEEPTVEIPWLDELRKLRVAELRREVQRYDVSIGSLQLKVKKLKEERERSLGEPDAGDALNGSGSGRGSDLKEKDDRQEDQIASPRSKPENAAGDKISGEYSGHSCKESNSTEPKVEQEVKVEERIKKKADPAVNGSRSGSGSDHVGGAEASYNGSSDTIAKGAVRSSAVEPNQALNESGESVAESKGGQDEEGTKESSDVQSSASLSRRRRRGRRLRASASAVAEPEAETSSPVRKVIDAEYQPLIAILDTIRSNKDGSVFARRLESQEGVRYRSLIRRHVDLEMVRNRIGRNGYAIAEFFRDLLLLCNNALVFYPKTSPESISAVHLRDLINKEITATLQRTPQTSPQSAKEPTPPPTAAPPAQPSLPPPPSKPKSDPEPDRLEKLGSLPPLVACRKRGSISGKPAKPGKRVVKVLKEEKKEREKKEIEEEDDDDEDDEDEIEEKERKKIADKKRTKQRTTVSRGLRTNKTRGNGSKGGGGGGGISKGEGGGATVAKNPKPDPVDAPKPDPADQEAKSGGPSTAKKRSAADFLNRMKSSSPSSNGKLVETMKSTSSSRRGGSDQLQKKKMKEESNESSAAASAAKRSVGRPPKRAVAMLEPPAKRAREERTPPLPKKRGRR